MYNKGFPVAKFTYNDQSGAQTNLFTPDSDGLCVPFFFTLAERGEPGKIYFGGAKELFPILGEETFRPGSAYWNSASKFLGTAMAGQGVNVMRLVDPDATTASLALFVRMRAVNITQYQLDSSGKRVKDKNGNYIVLTSSPGVPITEPGYRAEWFVRSLVTDPLNPQNDETFDTLVSVNSTDEGGAYYEFPVLGFKMKWPGAAGNRMGFRLYSSNLQDSNLYNSIASVLYRFVPMQLPTAISTTASPITNLYGSDAIDFSFKDTAIYNRTAYEYAFSKQIENQYVNQNTGESVLPYEIHIYSNYVEEAGQLVLDKSSELTNTSPYQIDLISGKDINGNFYRHFEVSTGSALVVNASVVNYCTAGSDGVTTFTKLDTLVKEWLLGDNHGEFTNLYQHPMTHFYDPGFTMDTKMALFNMLDLRDNFKIDVSTQDITLPLNTQAEDLSTGQALAFAAQLHPESSITGVGSHRVGVYAHAGRLVGSDSYTDIVPFTYNRLVQRRDLDGGLYVKGSSAGLPNSQVTLFQKPNWTADDDYIRSLAWAGAINVVMHASRTVFFYPSLRTVYNNDTSLLSDDEISDRILYGFKIARRVWATYSGVRRSGQKLFSTIKQEIDREMSAAFGTDDVTVTSTVFQTAEDSNLGYSISINLNFRGNPSIREFNFNVNVVRA